MTAPKTGIGIVDNTVSAVSNGINNVGSQIGNGLNNLGTQLGNASTVTDAVRDTISDLAVNYERNLANTFNGVGMALKGDYTGFDRTLIDAATVGIPGAGFINPDDTNRATGTQTAEQKLVAKAEADAKAVEDAAAAYQTESTLGDIRSVISGQIGARSRAPGRDMTLLSIGARPSGNTLLTVR